MSGPLAIAAVTAALKDLLNDGLLNHDLSSIGSFSVTSLPPDRVTTGQTEANQLNLFLYQVTPNAGWRNHALPSRDASGARLTNPPLALDLHYILTAYGAEDLNAEVLLGYAMQLMHETPQLSRAQLRTVLGGVSPVDGSIVPAIFGNLSAVDLADQVELIKITPVTLTAEDLSKMWTAMQARYRPTVAYMVSVVLIQATASVMSPLPVLKRGKDDRGPVAITAPSPVLTRVQPARSDLLPAAQLGDDLLLVGSNLLGQGPGAVVFTHAQAPLVRQVTTLPGGSAGRAAVHLPSIAEDPAAMETWAAGVYTVTLQVARNGTPSWPSNGVPLAVAPLITIPVQTRSPGDTLTVVCTPRLLPTQVGLTTLIFAGQSLTPASVQTPADTTQPTTLTFSVPVVAPGDYPVRLRVGGIDSLPVTVTGVPTRLDFDAAQLVHVT